jgi:hypothetical protein
MSALGPSPYAPLYYPSAQWPQDAKAFELTKGQHLKNMDSTLQRLAQHKLTIQVRTPDGQAVKGLCRGSASASFHILEKVLILRREIWSWLAADKTFTSISVT